MFAAKIKETTTTTGTGAYTLAGAQGGFRAYAVPFANGAPVAYHAVNASDPSQWEDGWGLLDTSAGTITRNLQESSTGSLINWSSGTKYIFCQPMASVLAALLANHIGTSRAGYLPAGAIWPHSGDSLLNYYNGSADVPLLPLALGSARQVLRVNDAGDAPIWGNDDGLNESLGSNVASAATTDIWADGGKTKHVTGTTTITSLGTAAQAGARRLVVFDGALTLTNGANLILPGGADIATAAGDVMEVLAETTTQHRVTRYMKADGTAVVAAGGLQIGAVQATTSGTAKDFTGIPAGTRQIVVSFNEVSLDGSDNILVQIGDSGGLETSAYLATAGSIVSTATGAVSSTAGFVIRTVAGTQVTSGSMMLTLLDPATNTWVASGTAKSNTTTVQVLGGSKALSAELDRLRITRSGSDSFDAGSVNILYQ